MITFTGLLQAIVFTFAFFGALTYINWPRHYDGTPWTPQEFKAWLSRFQDLPGFEHAQVLSFFIFFMTLLIVATIRSLP